MLWIGYISWLGIKVIDDRKLFAIGSCETWVNFECYKNEGVDSCIDMGKLAFPGSWETRDACSLVVTQIIACRG